MKRECTRSFWFITCCFWYVFFGCIVRQPFSVAATHQNEYVFGCFCCQSYRQPRQNKSFMWRRAAALQPIIFRCSELEKKLFNYWKLATKRTGKPTHSHQMNREKWFLSTGNKCNEIKLCRVTKELNAVPTANNSIGSNSIFTLWYAAWLKLDRVLGSEWQRLTSASERHVQ